jgi:membrane dipeptidase
VSEPTLAARDLLRRFPLIDGHNDLRPQATLAQVADHVEHVRRVAGVEHVGLGGDFDGTPDVTVGLEDVSTYPALFAELLARGWTEPDCAALAGGNLLRALRAAESAVASGS